MKLVLAALVAGAVAGLYASAAGAQTPTYQYLGLSKAVEAATDMPSGNVGWQNVCRERAVVRRDVRGRAMHFQVPMCNVVWISRRYFYNGNYYADPTFVTLLY